MTNDTTWHTEWHDWGKGETDEELLNDPQWKFKRHALSYYAATTAGREGFPLLHLGSCVECSESVVESLNRLALMEQALRDIADHS